MLNDGEETTRRYSESEGRKQSMSGATESITSRKRTRSPSDAGMAKPEPSPKRVKAKRQPPTEVPMWARKWTREWQNQYGGRNNGYIVKAHPGVSPHATPGPAPPLRPPPPTSMPQRQSPASVAQQIPVRPSTGGSIERPAGRTEKTYKNIAPLDELTRLVMDFIYREVIENGIIDSLDAGTEIEVEAKLGTIIDKDTDARMARIPVLNECVVNDWNLPIAFRSSMTETQHQQMNNHLNEAVKAAVGTRGRQKMKYVHLRESDRFYQLPSNYIRNLPPYTQERIQKQRKPPRVRLSTDQKTGKLLASIIKVRLADLHIFSPRTEFDWRISISLEMKYNGDVNSLQAAQDAGRAKEGRDKDRLSYEHQDIKIDLTQVTMEGSKEHELEFELPFDVLRDEAYKLRSQQPSGFTELVQNFVDDIRIATREFPRT